MQTLGAAQLEPADVYRRQRPDLLGRLSKAGLAYDEAEEVVQETWVEVLANSNGTIAVASINEIATTKAVAFAKDEALHCDALCERLVRISNAIANLTTPEQAVVLLTHFAGWKATEIAAQLNLSEQQVMSLLEEAQKKVANS